MSEEQVKITPSRPETVTIPLNPPAVSIRPELAISPDAPSADPSFSGSQRGENSLGPSPRVPVQKHYWTKEEVFSTSLIFIEFRMTS